jgi:hypothetical protein
MLGQSVAERWKFPPLVVDIIRDHHVPTDHASSIVYLADIIAHNEGILGMDYSGHMLMVDKYLEQEPGELIFKMNNMLQQSKDTIEGLI